MPDESLERIREARRKMEDLSAQIPAAMDAEKSRIEQRLKAQVDEQRARVEERTKEILEHGPEWIGEVRDVEFTPDGHIVPESIRRVINKWNDGYGNILFTDRSVDMTQVPEVSKQINTQKDAFAALSDGEKAKIQGDFDSSQGKSATSKPYSDFLRSEALGRRFRELKENPLMPFGKKP